MAHLVQIDVSAATARALGGFYRLLLDGEPIAPPPHGSSAPRPFVRRVALRLFVRDVDATFRRAESLGARGVIRPKTVGPEKTALLLDPSDCLIALV